MMSTTTPLDQLPKSEPRRRIPIWEIPELRTSSNIARIFRKPSVSINSVQARSSKVCFLCIDYSVVTCIPILLRTMFHIWPSTNLPPPFPTSDPSDTNMSSVLLTASTVLCRSGTYAEGLTWECMDSLKMLAESIARIIDWIAQTPCDRRQSSIPLQRRCFVNQIESYFDFGID